jgi:hypothetical protein
MIMYKKMKIILIFMLSVISIIYFSLQIIRGALYGWLELCVKTGCQVISSDGILFWVVYVLCFPLVIGGVGLLVFVIKNRNRFI